MTTAYTHTTGTARRVAVPECVLPDTVPCPCNGCTNGEHSIGVGPNADSYECGTCDGSGVLDIGNTERRIGHLGRFATELIRAYERDTGQKFAPSYTALHIGEGNHDESNSDS